MIGTAITAGTIVLVVWFIVDTIKHYHRQAQGYKKLATLSGIVL